MISPQVPTIILPCLDTLVCSVGFGFVQAMLAPHATRPEAEGGAGMSEEDVGFIFLAMGSTYVVFVPVVSRFVSIKCGKKLLC